VYGQRYVHIDRVEPHPDNVRDELGDLSELAASIKVHGVLQPLVVEPHPTRAGAFRAVAGHRRLAAARLAGRQQLPITVRGPRPDVAAEELMLVENWQREDLGPMDKARALGRLRDERGYTPAQIARSLGKAHSTISYYLTLLELDESSQRLVRDGVLSAADAVTEVRRVRRRDQARAAVAARARPGAAPAPAWEPDHFTSQHSLARAASTMCAGARHAQRRKYGGIACGQCWETVIRQDEQPAEAPLRRVS
jgi:ParB family chromosome partitioning protein